jgi:hypothetical protein
MFLINPPPSGKPSKKLQAMLLLLKQSFGEVPPHFDLFARLNPQLAEETLSNLFRLIQHKTINPNLFPCIRLHVAAREGYDYCIHFNSTMLSKEGYDDATLSAIQHDIFMIPLDSRHRILAGKSIKSLYAPGRFSEKDLAELYEQGWNDREIFDAFEHAGFIWKNGRLITTYLSMSGNR